MKYWQAKRAICLLSVPLMVVLLWAIPSTLQASIQLPDESLVDFKNLDQMLSSSESSMGASSSPRSGSTESDRQGVPTNDRRVHDPRVPSQAGLLPTSTSSGGSTSGTSTSSSGSGGTSMCPLASGAAANLSDAELVAWLSGEQRFSLPMPPGNELRRPPQALITS